MKYTIKGLTDSTLTLNTLKITLRGNSNKLGLYPNSIAKGVMVTTAEQMAEIQALSKNKYILAIPEEQQSEQEAYAHNSVPNSAPKSRPNYVTETSKETVYGEISKLAKFSVNISKDANEVLNKALDLYDRGLFTGTGTIELFQHTLAKKTGGALVPDSEVLKLKSEPAKAVSAKKGPKKISRASKVDQDDDEEGSVVMGTDGKAIKVSSKSRPVAEDEKLVDASLKAMAKLEAEEKAANEEAEDYDPIDEEKLDPSERMGNEVVISGGRTTKKVKMAQSILPKSKPEWINADGEKIVENVEEDVLEDSVSDAFVDKQDILDRAARDEDKFIE